MSRDGSVSPMMSQYLEIKAEHEGALLFYRMGDFYEMFFDDAVAASEALGIALTKRGRTKSGDIPMCGVPVHSASGYLNQLIKKGFRVAVCEQTEDPAEARKRGSTAVVAREVVRLITPGTLTEETLLDARRHNHLAAVSIVREDSALAWADISSGALSVIPCPMVKLGPQIARIAPTELLVSESNLDRLDRMLPEVEASLTPLAPVNFDSSAAERKLNDLFGVVALDGFGNFGRAEISAVGAIVAYLELTQKGKLPGLRPPVREQVADTLQIDAATRRNLEISEDFSGGRENSLIAAIDLTLTAGGARLLERRISAPSTSLAEIAARHDAIGHFVSAMEAKDSARDLLRGLPDIERALSRLCLERGGPRDAAAVSEGLSLADKIRERLTLEDLPGGLQIDNDNSTVLDGLKRHLQSALEKSPPLSVRDGNYIRDGFDAELDETRRLRDQARNVVAELQAEYVEETGIQSLKMKFNNILGYFIEVPAGHSSKLLAQPFSQTFIHRQTTANAARFTTHRLSELESRILGAGARADEIEKRIFEDLRVRISEAAPAINPVASWLAEVDLSAALAELAVARGWCRPEMNDRGALEISGGRHPVVEQALAKASGSPFISNDCVLDEPSGAGPRVQLLTGPNMSGKSTYLRQNALIALLAQSGSFVPAASARIGIASQLFSRVGAADELARGRSTFMVEMVETAAILNQADSGALVILDEIGRGTATYDGLSIAWATLEHLHDVNRCRALFATHYHELARLSDRLDRLSNANVAVREWENDVIFLHEVRPGAADRSYGVQVAKLAGIPASVVARAREILDRLESGELEGSSRTANLLNDLPLFSSDAEIEQEPRPSASESEIENRLKAVNPDDLTPREALALIYELADAVGCSSDG